MCGIAGIFCPKNNNKEQLQYVVSAMIATLVHRGPDGQGIHVEANSGLAVAHCRLAIQDLSVFGAQPMESATGRFLIIFNGEIYNFNKLRKELQKAGLFFRGGSDTEVLLAAIEAWGLRRALSVSIGMFAFGLWDRKDSKLHLCRDRLGEKPLYYGKLQQCFVFASELKALKKVTGWTGDIDRGALTLFMRYGYIPAPYTIYKDVYKLIPGTVLTVSERDALCGTDLVPFADSSPCCAIHPVRYWSLADVASKGYSNPITDYQEAQREFKDLFAGVVREQMVADVPVGAFLSGGIDSTLVTAFMQNETSRPVNTFTIGFDNRDFNEANYAREVAQSLGTQHTEVYLSLQDVLNIIPQLPKVYDEPHADSSQLPAILVAKVARQHVTVCLSGDGGDELFVGYNRYLKLENLWRRSKILPISLRNAIGELLLFIPHVHWERIYSLINTLVFNYSYSERAIGLKIQKISAALSKGSIEEMYKTLISYWDNPVALVVGGSEPSNDFWRTTGSGDTSNFINQALLWDSLYYLPDDNLCKVDRASMAVSLETRLPLLDHRIVEFSWRLPLNMKVRGKEGKWLLRQVLNQYIDSRLINRPKMGFSVPIADWLRGPLRDWANDLLSEEKINGSGFFDYSLVRKKWDEHISGKRNWQLGLWAVLTFQAWHEQE